MENNFLLESLATCYDVNAKVVMDFMVNTAFVNYQHQIDNLTESHKLPILKNTTTFEQILPISLNISKFDTSLLMATNTPKDFIHQYK